MARLVKGSGAEVPVTEEGQILDNTYRLVRLVAEGGMGLVYEATHARLAGRYAIKVLPPRWSKDPDAMARFDREARITSSLQHPNIVQIIDFNTAEDGTEYLVMEYLRGETLAARLARVGPLDLETVVSIVEQIASGLAAAHGHGIVHRDLKPENVLLMQVEGRDGDWVKILDFGISKVTNASLDTIGPASKGVIGTPQYMSPEQCEGRTQDVGPATDQFALAVITYELLTGHRPFAGDSIGDVFFRVLHTEPPAMNLLADVAPRIESIVRRGLAKAIRDRYPSVTAFAEALRDAVLARGHSLVAQRTGPSAGHLVPAGTMDALVMTPPARRAHPTAALLAAAVVVIAAAFIARTARMRRAAVPELITAAFASPGQVQVEPLTDLASKDVANTPRPPASADDTEDRGSPGAADVSAPSAGSPAGPTVAWTAPLPATTSRTAAAALRSAPATPARRATAGRTADARTRRPAGPVSKSQPPPFRPVPLDDDAVLPLDEDYNERR